MNKFKILLSAKRILLFITSLISCYTRHIAQYNSPPWHNGLLTFIGSWIVHFLLIFLVIAIVLALLVTFGKYLFPNKGFSSDKNIEEVIVYVSLTIIVISLLVLFFHSAMPYIDDYNDNYE